MRHPVESRRHSPTHKEERSQSVGANPEMAQMTGLGGKDSEIVLTTVTPAARTREEKLGASGRDTDDVRKKQTKFLEIKKRFRPL